MRSVTLATILLMTCSACTIVKPVVCILSHPTQRYIDAFDSLDETDDEESHNELPAGWVIPLLPVLFPLSFAYYGTTGAVVGVVSGLVSDLNVLAGHATVDSTFENLSRPWKTNAKPPERSE